MVDNFEPLFCVDIDIVGCVGAAINSYLIYFAFVEVCCGIGPGIIAASFFGAAAADTLEVEVGAGFGLQKN